MPEQQNTATNAEEGLEYEYVEVPEGQEAEYEYEYAEVPEGQEIEYEYVEAPAGEAPAADGIEYEYVEAPAGEAPAADGIEYEYVEAPAGEAPAADGIEYEYVEAPAGEAPAADGIEYEYVEAPAGEAPAADGIEYEYVEAPAGEAPAADGIEYEYVEAPAGEAPAADGIEYEYVEAPAGEAPAADGIEYEYVEAPAAEAPAADGIEYEYVEAPAGEAPAADGIEYEYVEAPAAEAPAADGIEYEYVEAPNAETPAVEPPAPQAPVEAAPAADEDLEYEYVEAPAAEAPAVESPAPQAPVEAAPAADEDLEYEYVEAPAAEAPAVESPAPQAPVADTASQAPSPVEEVPAALSSPVSAEPDLPEEEGIPHPFSDFGFQESDPVDEPPLPEDDFSASRGSVEFAESIEEAPVEVADSSPADISADSVPAPVMPETEASSETREAAADVENSAIDETEASTSAPQPAEASLPAAAAVSAIDALAQKAALEAAEPENDSQIVAEETQEELDPKEESDMLPSTGVFPYDGMQSNSFTGSGVMDAILLTNDGHAFDRLNEWYLLISEFSVTPLEGQSGAEIPLSEDIFCQGAFIHPDGTHSSFANQTVLSVPTDQTSLALCGISAVPLAAHENSTIELSDSSGMLIGSNGVVLMFSHVNKITVPAISAVQNAQPALRNAPLVYDLSKPEGKDTDFFSFSADDGVAETEKPKILIKAGYSLYGWNVVFDNDLAMSLSDVRTYQTRHGSLPETNGVIRYGKAQLTFKNAHRICVFEKPSYCGYGKKPE